MTDLPVCPLCGSKPTFGILGARGPSVWCIGPCPLSYGTFTPEQWRRLAAPPVVYACQFCHVREPEFHKPDCQILNPPVHDTAREVLRAAEHERFCAGPITTCAECRRYNAILDAWIAAGRPGLKEKK